MARLGLPREEADCPGLPVIWMSGYLREVAGGDGRSADVQPFLQKPISPDVLIRTVADVLSLRPAAKGGGSVS